MEKYDTLKLENQLCFPLYAAAKELVRHYGPFLEKLDLTYTQYITMMVLWDRGGINVKELGKRLYLDSGTLTPLLKKLETKGLIRRERAKEDERQLQVCLTKKGEKLRDKALAVPPQIASCVELKPEEAGMLYTLLYKVLAGFSEEPAAG